MQKYILSATTAIFLCAGCDESEKDTDTEPGSIEERLYLLSGGVWANGVVPVCWENPSLGDQTQRNWVRDAVETTWDAVSGVNFVGWGTCSPGEDGVRIRITDAHPRTLGLGTNLDGVPQGMLLNFTFDKWGLTCKTKLEYCIRTIAVHEFGHAMGFAHEQNRPDTPENVGGMPCAAQHQGSDGDLLLGEWDLASVMNYCNPKWSGDGMLSAGDVSGVKSAYGNQNPGVNHADIVWHNAQTGQVQLWLMKRAEPLAKLPLGGSADIQWRLVGTGDFDGDGDSDVFWQHAGTGKVAIWTMDGSHRVAGPEIQGFPDTTWKVVGAGDFDGDGKDDVLWHHPTSGKAALWFMNGTSIAASKEIQGSADTDWKIVGAGDFDGDGKDDILWHHAIDRRVAIWFMNKGAIASDATFQGSTDKQWRIAGVGAFDKNNRADILWQHGSNGKVALWFMNGGNLPASATLQGSNDPAWKVVGAADFDGSGGADILWHHQATGKGAIWFMNGAQRLSGPEFPGIVDPTWRMLAVGQFE